MKNCHKCGRPLNEGENSLCPACKSTKAHKNKRWGEIIVGCIVVVGSIAVKFFTGGKGGGRV